jgi:hemerythrin-like metal-binding protein/PAS domain S-box-containing protein/putative nucleotidyltransferase with HDIG domain
MHSTPHLNEVFPWNNNFETGIPVVDEQHRKLVGLINRMAIKLVQDSDPVEINVVIGEMADYASYHFRTEEGVWNDRFHDDEWVLNHKGLHAKFIARVSELRNEVESSSERGLYEQILRFLIYWLAHHILDDDMRMAKVLHAMDEGQNLEEAKQTSCQEMSDSIEVFIDTLLGMYGSLSSRTLDLMEERQERDRIAEALTQSEQREREFGNKIITSIPGLVYLYDDQYHLIRWNKRHASDLGYSEKELRGKFVLDFFVAEKHARIKETLGALDSGEQVEIEEDVRLKDGSEVPYLLTGVPIDIDGKHHFLGTGINISQLKRAEQELERRTCEIKDAFVGTVIAVGKAMEARDPYTAGHQQRVANISIAIAERLGLDEDRIEGLRLGASIHDIGKLAIPSDMLVKPTRLTALEYNVIQTHAQYGADILKGVKFPWPILEIVSQHHERLNGSGYPRGLKGDEIGLEARIVAVADVYEAMSAHRPYRPSLGVTPALDELTRNRGKLYDTDVVDALQQLLEEDPARFESAEP